MMYYRVGGRIDSEYSYFGFGETADLLPDTTEQDMLNAFGLDYWWIPSLKLHGEKIPAGFVEGLEK